MRPARRPLTAGLVALLLAGALPAAVAPPPLSDTPTARSDTDTPAGEEEEGVLVLAFTDGEQALPVQVQLLNPQGHPVLPGPLARPFIALGEAQLNLPPGVYRIRACAGPRRVQRDTTIAVKAGALVSRTLSLPDFLPVRQRGWVLCDPLHRAEPGGGRAPSHLALTLQARAADIHILGLPQAPQTTTEAVPSELPVQLLGVATGADGLVWALDRTPGNERLANLRGRPEECPTSARLGRWRAAGACPVWRLGRPPPPDGEEPLTAREKERRAEFLFATLAGPLYDAVEITRHPASLRRWWHLLDQGYRIPALHGGTTTRPEMPALGLYVPRAALENPDRTLELLRAGRTVVSNGPFLALSIEGAGPGDIIPPRPDGARLRLEVLASSHRQDSIQRIEVVYNGAVLRYYRGAPEERTMHIEDVLELPRSGWVCVVYHSRDKVHWAVTNPVYLAAPDTTQPPPLSCQVRLRATRQGTGTACLVEAWDCDTLLGRYALPATGRTLQLPPTAHLRILAPTGEPLKTTSLYGASGARRFLQRLAQEAENLDKVLRSPRPFKQLRTRLQEMDLVVDVEAERPGGE